MGVQGLMLCMTRIVCTSKGKMQLYIKSGTTPVKQNLANKDSDRVMREYALNPNMGAILVSQASNQIV